MIAMINQLDMVGWTNRMPRESVLDHIMRVWQIHAVRTALEASGVKLLATT
ncbi:hypothetical protein CFII64_24099 [Pseudomonas sp. CFII64]|nr:hypothetical protein CFII64_24099 [Pseudomonas sp. CFII64]